MSPGALVGANPRFGRLVLAVAAGVLVLGASALGSAKLDFLPEFMAPSVQVQTEALGLSAAEVEQLVTVPLEQDLLNGVPWLDRIHSRSQPGLSAIDLVFEPGTDLYAARQMVQERLTQAHALPNVGSPPVMVQPLASASRVAMIGLHSKSVSLIDMSVLARWKIRPRLMGIPGVANVSIYGQRDRQLQVQVDPATPARQGGQPRPRSSRPTGNALWVSPLTFVEASTPGTGGFVERPQPAPRRPARAADHHGRRTWPRSPSRAPTSPRCGSATSPQVIEDHQPLIGDAVTAEPALFLVIQKFPEADTADRDEGRRGRRSQVCARAWAASTSTRRSTGPPASSRAPSTRSASPELPASWPSRSARCSSSGRSGRPSSSPARCSSR